jgi:uncharacterized membrane protein
MTRHTPDPSAGRAIGQGAHPTVDEASGEAESRQHAAAHGARDIGGTTAERNIVTFGVALLICAILFLVPDLSPPGTRLESDRAHARIVSLPPSEDQVAPVGLVQLLDGDRRGLQVSATLTGPSGDLLRPDYQQGDEVLLSIDPQPDGTVAYAVIDRWRLPVLGWLMAAFALVTVAIAGWRGLRALTSLAITVVVVIRILIPLLLSGYSPVALAIGLGIVISVLSFLMTQGLSRSTLAAIGGTAAGLLVAGALAVIVSDAARFTAAQGSEALVVVGQLVSGSIDLSGLLLAGVIFGGLGVINDVAITQAVTVEELRRLNPSLARRALFRRTMSVGTAHLAASVNTLVFAYLGAGLPILVLLAVQVHRLDLAVNDEHIAVEVVRAVVGAIGVLSAVPLTTAIAAWWAVPAGSRRQSIPRLLMARPLPAGADWPSTDVAVSSSADIAIGDEHAAPARDTPRAEETAPAEDVAPAEDTLLADETAPAEDTPPTVGASATDEVAPAEETPADAAPSLPPAPTDRSVTGRARRPAKPRAARSPRRSGTKRPPTESSPE